MRKIKRSLHFETKWSLSVGSLPEGSDADLTAIWQGTILDFHSVRLRKKMVREERKKEEEERSKARAEHAETSRSLCPWLTSSSVGRAGKESGLATSFASERYFLFAFYGNPFLARELARAKFVAFFRCL